MNKITISGLLLLISTLLSAHSVLACEYHNGFGNNRMFGANHALQPQMSAVPRIKLQYPYFKRVAINQTASVLLNFQAPQEFSQIKIELVPTEQIDISSAKTFDPQLNSGSQTIEFLAKAEGRHTITIKINALLNDKPYSVSQKVYINAKAAS